MILFQVRMVKLEVVASRVNQVHKVHKVPQDLLGPAVLRALMASLDRGVPQDRMEFRETAAQQDQLDHGDNRAPKEPLVVAVQ